MDSARISLTSGTFVMCENNDSAVCAIIDDHGYIIASNQGDRYTGQFIGERLGSIVKSFETMPLIKKHFKKVVLDDTQAECPVSDEISAANILLTPAKIIFAAFTALCKSAYWLFIQLGIFLISLFEHAQNVSAESPRTIRESCTKQMPFYKFDLPNLPDTTMKGVYSCDKCRNNYRMRKIPETNALLLFAQVKAECDCFSERVSLKHLRKEASIDWCDPPKQAFRKRPSSCYNVTSEQTTENIECGAGFMTKPSLLLITISVAFLWFAFG